MNVASAFDIVLIFIELKSTFDASNKYQVYLSVYVPYSNESGVIISDIFALKF